MNGERGHWSAKAKREVLGTRLSQDRTIAHGASRHDCQACPPMSRCCPDVSFSKVAGHIQQDARDVARAIARTRE